MCYKVFSSLKAFANHVRRKHDRVVNDIPKPPPNGVHDRVVTRAVRAFIDIAKVDLQNVVENFGRTGELFGRDGACVNTPSGNNLSVSMLNFFSCSMRFL